MANNTATIWLPGTSDKIGFGLNIFGNLINPVLKDKFIELTPNNLPLSEWNDHQITGVKDPYKLPTKIRYTPLPTGETKYIVADSKMTLTQKLGTKANVTATYGAFTGTLKASYSDFNETTEDRWYCLTDGSQTVYSLHASNFRTSDIHPQVQDNDIYKNLLAVLDRSQQYNPADQEVYFTFFNWYGTHVITDVVMGGGLHLYTSVEKTYVKQETEVTSSLDAEFGAIFKGGMSADWKRTHERWSSNRQGSLTLFGGNVGLLSGKIGSGRVLPDTDLSSDHTQWALSVPTNPMMVDFTLIRIGDVFEGEKRKMLVNDAYQRYAESYLQLTFAHRENRLNWRRQPVAVPVSPIHEDPNIKLNDIIPRFQGWCVIDRRSAEVAKVFPFAERTALQEVPAELKDAGKYNNDNFVVLFSHWEGTKLDPRQWTEQPFTAEMASFLRQCGGGPVLADYNNRVRIRNVNPYDHGFYVLCGVMGSGEGNGKEFTNIYDQFTGGGPAAIKDIIVPLVPSRTGSGFRLDLLR